MTKALLEIIKRLYGSKALSKTIGTRTNVITLPDKETKKFVTQELNIEAASDAAAQKAKDDIEKLFPDIPKMNDQEILTLTGNLRRLENKINPPSAEVFEFGTKQPVSREGIASLTEQAGQKAPPGTLMGNLESRLNQLRASGKELEDIVKDMAPKDPYADIRRIIENPTPEEAAIKAKEKARLSKVFEDVMQSQKTMSKLQDEGLVRAAVRYKMMDDVKKGTLKLPKNLEDVVRGASNEEDVITVFRNNYGEDALEQVDSLIPDFYNMTSPTDAVKKIEKDFPNIKPRKIETKQTMDLEEAAKAEKENILIPDDTEEFATGGRVGFADGGSKGLNYLMGINRTGFQRGTSKIFDQLEMNVPYPYGHRVEYAKGGMTLEQLQAKAPPGEFLAYINPEEAGVLKALGGSGKKINGIPSFFASGPGDTGGAGGADGAGGNDEGGSGDTGDMGSEAANAAATAAGAASVGAGVGPTDPGVTVGSMMGNFGKNVANMAKANPISSMIASALFGPIGSLGLNAAMAYGSTGTTGTTSTTGSEGSSDPLIQQAIADPLGLNPAARDMSRVNALYNQYRTNLGFQSGGRVGYTTDRSKKARGGVAYLMGL